MADTITAPTAYADPFIKSLLMLIRTLSSLTVPRV